MSADRRSFSGGGFVTSAYVDEADADPRVGLVNLADVMLVFACGLMLALVVNWNIDLPSATEIEMGEQQEIDASTLESMTDDASAENGSNYTERGYVYEDKTTGKLYLVEPDDSAAGTSAASGAEGVTG
jgi:hypothetical protein